MNYGSENQYMSKLQTFSEISSILIIIIGFLFLTGWAFDIGILKSPNPYFSTINSNAALCFVFIGLSLWLLQTKRLNQRNERIARISAIIVALIGFLTIIEYLFGINLGIDHLLFQGVHGTLNDPLSYKMSFNTALNLLITGIALLIFDKETKNGQRPAQYLLITMGFISLLAIAGYLYHASELYQIASYTGIAIYAALMFILILSCALSARPDNGIMEILTSDRIAGVFGRRIMFAVIVIPLILGWLRFLGEQMGFYGSNFRAAISTVSTIAILAILVWLSILSIDKTDIRRMRAEENIKRQANLLNLTHDAIFVRNLDNEITFWNKGSEETYGWSRGDALGRVTHELLQAEYPKPLDEIQADVLNYGQWDGELKHKKRDGTSIIVLSRWSLQKDVNGKTLGFLEINTDITKRKEAQEKLKELIGELKRSNYELQQFTYITSHDLQEPLRSIASFSQLLERRYKNKLDKDADEYINFVVDASTRMKEMIQGLLDYSNIGTRKEEFKSLNVEDILKQVLSNLNALIDENDAVVAHDLLPVITADRGLLVKLFQNLIENAIKFRKPDEHPKIHISAYLDKKNKEYVFSVADNGIGIETQYSDKIFEIFKRLHTIDEYRGTGIGLAICKRIVERHGGHIWVESELGRGSTFYFTIPTEHLK
jgi:PAS domain S-box-containing protein